MKERIHTGVTVDIELAGSSDRRILTAGASLDLAVFGLYRRYLIYVFQFIELNPNCYFAM